MVGFGSGMGCHEEKTTYVGSVEAVVHGTRLSKLPSSVVCQSRKRNCQTPNTFPWDLVLYSG